MKTGIKSHYCSLLRLPNNGPEFACSSCNLSLRNSKTRMKCAHFVWSLKQTAKPRAWSHAVLASITLSQNAAHNLTCSMNLLHCDFTSSFILCGIHQICVSEMFVSVSTWSIYMTKFHRIYSGKTVLTMHVWSETCVCQIDSPSLASSIS